MPRGPPSVSPSLPPQRGSFATVRGSDVSAHGFRLVVCKCKRALGNEDYPCERRLVMCSVVTVRGYRFVSNAIEMKQWVD